MEHQKNEHAVAGFPQEDLETADEFKPLVKNHSLLAGEGMPLNTIADSIRLINRRDSERSLLYQQRKRSPWRLDSIVKSPMISSPHIMAFPDLSKRREMQIIKHEDELKMKKINAKYDKIIKDVKRHRSVSVGEDNFQSQNETFIPVHTEEEQWEKKRMQRLKQIMEHSTSHDSLALSIGSSASGGATSTVKYSPTLDLVRELKEEFAKQTNPPSVSIMYGIVNGVIVLPVIMSFGNIIYHDDFFRPYLPVLVKLTVVSGVVHQLCFSAFSTLPFAVGSVQDAGLIFLATIASSIVEYCKEQNASDEEILATTLIGLSIFTASLGLGLYIIGQLRLAQYVQKLPTCVVGGYLAFIGFFCGQSALSLLSHIGVSGVLQWYKFLHKESLVLIAPGLFGGCGIYIAVRKLKHMAVLPFSIALIILSFYGVLYYTNTSLEEAKDFGWMSKADAPPAWNHTWDYIRFDKVVWHALPRQTFTVLSMIFVVALSSSLDIAAIDLEVPKPLAYNYELKMVGLSNLISGMLGGYTGSYIFSQSIFSLRAGIRSRLAGFISALFEAVTVIMPISVLSFVPNFVFASLLIMICVDLMVEWLWDVRKKLAGGEYFMTLLTFSLIQGFGVEYGILLGVITHFILCRAGILIPSKSSEDESKVQGSIIKVPTDVDKANYTTFNDDNIGLSLE